MPSLNMLGRCPLLFVAIGLGFFFLVSCATTPLGRLAPAWINPDPAAPGFKHIFIKSNPVADLTWAKASYDSIRGRIASAWTLKGGVFRLNVSIPANCTATVWLPASERSKIREGRRSLAKAEGVTFRRIENGRAVVDVASGDYVFVVQP